MLFIYAGAILFQFVARKIMTINDESVARSCNSFGKPRNIGELAGVSVVTYSYVDLKADENK